MTATDLDRRAVAGIIPADDLLDVDGWALLTASIAYFTGREAVAPYGTLTAATATPATVTLTDGTVVSIDDGAPWGPTPTVVRWRLELEPHPDPDVEAALAGIRLAKAIDEAHIAAAVDEAGDRIADRLRRH